MPTLGRVGRQLKSLLWRASIAEEVDAELDFHIEAMTRELMETGQSREAARAEAVRRFGDLRGVSDICRRIGEDRERDVQRTEYLSDLRHDVTIAIRQLARSRGFAATAIVTLALGVGATTAIFSITDAVVLRALPFPDPDRVVEITGLLRDETNHASAADYTDWHEQTRASFSQMAAGVSGSGFTLAPVASGDTPELIGGGRVTADYFGVFAVSPVLGRTFLAEEDAPGAADVVVLSDRLWKRRLAADPHVVGRELRMNGERYRVIGVMPSSFDITADGDELWVPLALTPADRANRGSHYLSVYGRLAPNVTRERAAAALRSVAAALAKKYPQNVDSAVVVRSFADELVGGYRARLLILLGAVGLVLLIACANVANLLLARGAARSKEFAIRSALGAASARIIRQLLTESLVLAAIGCALGLVIARFLVRGIVALSPENVPRLDHAGIDARVLVFTLLVALASSLIFGLAPALRTARPDLQSTLREGGRGSALGARRDALRALLVSAEVALAIMLLAGAGLLIRSAILLQSVAPGFDPHGVLTARMILPPAQYDSTRVANTYGRIRDEVARIPGVTVAALSSIVPLSNSQMGAGVGAADEPDDPAHAVQANFRIVSPEYFAAMKMPIRRGRSFSAHDDMGAPNVAIINEALARKLWPGKDPIGRQMTGIRSRRSDPRALLEVVGVVGDLRDAGLDHAVKPEFYFPVAQTGPSIWPLLQQSLVLVARGTGDPTALERPLRRAVMNVDPSLPVAEVTTMEHFLSSSLATSRFNTLLLATLGGMALLLASVGIYGVISYFVSQRTQEIGIRMALGATPRNVLALVVRRGLAPVAVGAAIGLLGAVAATRVLQSQLFGVSATDPVTFAAVIAMLLGVAAVASWLPARRATRVDPVSAIGAG